MQKNVLCPKRVAAVAIRPDLRLTAQKRCRNLPTKMLLVMRWTLFLLVVSMMSVHAAGHAQQITYAGKDVPVKKMLNAIRLQTGYQILSTEVALEEIRPLSLNVKGMPLQHFLDLILQDTPLEYVIEAKTIMITRKTSGAGYPVIKPAEPALTGRILDQRGQPLPGATVLNRKSGKTVITAADGSFSIDAAASDELRISYVGFISMDIRLGADRSVKLIPRADGQTGLLTLSPAGLIIRLLPAETNLSEVIINKGYYTESQRLSTGNVSRITAKEISDQPVGDPLAALQGRIPGLIVTQSSGVPGSNFNVQLRGRTSIDPQITVDQPLFVVDGVPTANNNGFLNQFSSALGFPETSSVIPGGLSPFASINPQDIESIEVLKDADATAIYGSRGANGVILITTKRGSMGKSSAFVNVSQGWGKASRTVDWLNTQQYVAMRQEAFRNDGVTPTVDNAFDLLVWDTTRYTDFKKMMIGGTAHTSDIQAGISGGNQQTQFRLSGAFREETTVFSGPWKVGRASADANIQHQSADQRFRLNFSASYSAGNSLLPTEDLAQNITLIPNLQLYDDAGNIAWNEGGYTWNDNPLVKSTSIYRVKTDNLNANLQLHYRILPELTLRSSIGYNTILTQEHKTFTIASQNPIYANGGSAYFANNNFRSWIWEPQMDYHRRLGQSEVQILVGASVQQQLGNSSSISGSGYTSDDMMNSLAGATEMWASNASSEYRYMAFFGRALYNYKQKYLLNISARRDGSSRFGPGKQHAVFGAAGAAWIFTEEQFMSGTSSWLSFGKLRGSYGTTGNDKIPNYQYLDTYENLDGLYQDSSMIRPSKLFNPDYQWESTRKLELAVELGFLQDKLMLAAAWFRNVSSNQLINYNLPGITGFTRIIANFPAKVRNSGLELSLNSTNFRDDRWQWTSSFNLTVPSNRLLAFPNLANSAYYSRYSIGQPLNLINLYRYQGVDPDNGFYRAEDVNKDGRLSARDDYQVLGHFDPSFYGGFRNAVRYRNWEFTTFFDFRKQNGTSWQLAAYARAGAMGNKPVTVLDRWQQPGDVSPVMRFTQKSSDGRAAPYIRDLSATDGTYTDASFIKLRNATLAYTLPQEWLHRAKIQSLRLYLLAQNLFTITSYKGADPEVQNLRRLAPLQNLTAGIQINL